MGYEDVLTAVDEKLGHVLHALVGGVELFLDGAPKPRLAYGISAQRNDYALFLNHPYSFRWALIMGGVYGASIGFLKSWRPEEFPGIVHDKPLGALGLFEQLQTFIRAEDKDRIGHSLGQGGLLHDHGHPAARRRDGLP